MLFLMLQGDPTVNLLMRVATPALRFNRPILQGHFTKIGIVTHHSAK